MTERGAIRSRGLTLIELLMAIAILGIALALASPFFVYTFGSFFSTDIKARTQAAAMIAINELEGNLDDALDITLVNPQQNVNQQWQAGPAGATITFTKLVIASGTTPQPSDFYPGSASRRVGRYVHDASPGARTLTLFAPTSPATPLVVARNIATIRYFFDANDWGELVPGTTNRRNNYVNVEVNAHIGPLGTGARSGDVTVTDRIQTHSRRAGQ